MEKFRGIPFKCLPREGQIRLANQLDQDDGLGKDYMVFAQTLEKKCHFSFGIVDFDALKVLRSRKHPSATLALFDQYYANNSKKITLDLVYLVLQEMGLDDCTAVLDELWEDINKRHLSTKCKPYYADRQFNDQRCSCDSCKPLHTEDHENVPSDNTQGFCHPPTTSYNSTTSQPLRMNLEPPMLNCPQSLHSNLYSRIHPDERDRLLFPSPQVVHCPPQNNPVTVYPDQHMMHIHQANMLNSREHESFPQEVRNWVQRGPAVSPVVPKYRVPDNEARYSPHTGHPPQNSTSTVQLPYYPGSSLKTPVTQVSTFPGPETGVIPKKPWEKLSASDSCVLSPLAKQYRADNRHCLQRVNSSPHSYSSFAHYQNEPQTLKSNCGDYRRQPSQVNDLGRDTQLKQVNDRQCTCPPSVRTEYSNSATANGYQNGKYPPNDWCPYPPSDIEDDEEEQTKLLELDGSSSSNLMSQCTCQSLAQNDAIRRPSNKSDAERRYSDPPESLSSSDNCSVPLHVKRSSSEEELKRNNLSPQGSVGIQKVQRLIKLFLTFADDSEEHMEEVLTFGAQLKEMGYSVKCDMFDQTIQKLIKQPVSSEMQNSMQQFFSNSYDWLDYQIQNSAFLVFCISPKYFQYVRPQEQIYGYNTVTSHSVGGVHGVTVGAQPNDCHLHTKYIYNQACSEHFQTLSQNKRFFPVLFPKSGASRNHIPSIFKSTLIFNYPDPNNSLLNFLHSQLTERCNQ
ncbi:uncharacterized protein LOC132559791 [Ylistrum balloti]|uniref:uncharacterized protein LOC132559791 n=1 Tax=Ylistrum balloti TaxID=509963 RepID=UPI002905F5F1|nr:uncharacterized protein LOC132559791 [Ylistrum balloti]